MEEKVALFTALFAAVTLLTLLAKRIAIPPPILLVPAGILLAFIPNLPQIELDPHLVLSLFLPPIVFAAAVDLSWLDIWRNIRPISLLAVGCVVFTTLLVGVVAHWLLPWMPWAAAFTLGAAVSPPDAVAATSMAGRLGLPRRLVNILEGEGVINDATALTAYRFAIAAVLTGTFSAGKAVLTFGAIAIGETLFGLAVGWCFAQMWPRISDASIEIALSLLIPFVAYLPPEHFGGSGVLATVVAGFYIGEQGVTGLESPSRLSGTAVWEMIRFSLENILFLLTGLQLRHIVGEFQHGSVWPLFGAGAILSLAVILIRFIWVYPATYIPRWAWPALQARDPAPPWQYPFVIAFAGMRGGISLAAALAIPETTSTGERFPGRAAIILLTFCVILTTLVLQGLTLPFVARRLGIAERGKEEQEEDRQKTLDATRLAAESALARLQEVEAGYDPKVVTHVRRHYERRLGHLNDGHATKQDGHLTAEVNLRRDTLSSERGRIRALRESNEISEDVRIHLERVLDLEEARLLEQREPSSDE